MHDSCFLKPTILPPCCFSTGRATARQAMTSSALTGKKACVGGMWGGTGGRGGGASDHPLAQVALLACHTVCALLCVACRQGYAASGFDKHGYDR